MLTDICNSSQNIWPRPEAYSELCVLSKYLNMFLKHKPETLWRMFFRRGTQVQSTWNGCLPFVDYFPGQIICFKRNLHPLWGLLNNAKAVVSRIFGYKSASVQDPLMSMDDTITCAMRGKMDRYEILAKQLIPFSGDSALPGVPGIICVPWTSTTTKLNGMALKVSAPLCHL